MRLLLVLFGNMPIAAENMFSALSVDCGQSKPKTSAAVSHSSDITGCDVKLFTVFRKILGASFCHSEINSLFHYYDVDQRFINVCFCCFFFVRLSVSFW